MAERTTTVMEPGHAKGSSGIAMRLADDSPGPEKGTQEGFASPKPGGDIATKFVANGGEIQALSLSPTVADLDINVSEVPLHGEGTRKTQDRRNDSTGGAINKSMKGLASPKPCGVVVKKIANKAMPNFGTNLELAPTPAIADVTRKFPETQMPKAKETRASEDHGTVHTRGPKNGEKRGFLFHRGNKIANKGTMNKKMDGRVKNGKQLNAEGRSAVIARWEQKRAYGRPPPKRGDVKKAILDAGVKKLIDTGKNLCCASGPVDVDAIVQDLPVPTKSAPTATLWAKVEV